MLALDTSTQIYKPQNALPGVGGLAPAQAVPARVAPLTPATATTTLGGPGGTPQPTPNVSLGFKPNLTPAVLNSPAAAAATPTAGSSTMGGPGGTPSWGSLGSLGLTPASVTNPAPASALPGGGNSATMSPAPPSQLPGVSPAPSAPATSGSSAPTTLGYGQTAQFGPGNDLQSTQILPGQESNRFDLARQALDTYAQQQLPQFRAQVRDTIGNNAAMGRLGSGMLNTSLGNLDLAQQQDYNNMSSNLLNTALGNQITDNANQRNELRAERDYQTQQGNTAFGQGLQSAELGDALTNSAFGRALQQEQAGYAENPANTSLLLSSIFGNQAGQAGQALSGLINSTTQNNALNNSGLSQILQEILGQGGSGGAPSPVDTSGSFGIPTTLPWPTNTTGYGLPPNFSSSILG